MSERLGIRLSRSPGPRRVLIIGAGVAGTLVVEEIATHPDLNYLPVGFLDDDPGKHGKTIRGVPVLGGARDLGEAVTSLGADEILIAIPSATGDELRTVLQHCWDTGRPFRTIPGVFQLISGRTVPAAARALRVEDLLRPRLTQADVSKVTEVLRGRRVLVTGAGGSIGGEIARQILSCEPSALTLLDRYENGLHAIDLEVRGRLRPGVAASVVGDVGDGRRMRATLARHRPDIVFHAAADKHVPLSEENAAETVRNNLVATLAFARACVRQGVERFVFISTDKAASPCSVMGASKRLCEIALRGVFRRSRGRHAVVRFGNVVGSNGSVVRIFEDQIARGGPVTVTAPRMTRYFMTLSEAAQLSALNSWGRRQRVRTVPLGIELDHFDLATDGAAVRREFGILAAAPVAGMVARFERHKGHDVFVRAAAAVRERLPEARFLLVGDAQFGLDLEVKQEVRDLVARLGLEDAITFTGFRSDVPACLAAMDVVVHGPVNAQPGGLGLLEAMAMARSVVTTSSGDRLEWMIPGETGVLVPGGDAGAMADAIVGLLGDCELRARMGRAGRARIEAAFTAERMVGEMETAFDELLTPAATAVEGLR